MFTQLNFFRRDYELKCGDEIIASIPYPKWYSSNFEIQWGKIRWFVYQPSIWKSLVEIKEVNKQLPFASYKKVKFKSEGTVDLPMGQQLKICFGFFKGSYEIKNVSGECLVLIKDKYSFKDKSTFYIQQRSELLDKYPWVTLLAWNISAQRKRRSAVAAT